MSISFVNYRNTEQIIKDKYNQRQELVEKSIIKLFYHVNDAYKIAEKQLNQKMKKYSLQMLDKYQDNPDIDTWNLKKMKEKFDGLDIYVVDENLQIIRSTYKKDIGLDFSKYPSFAKLLRQRMQGTSFKVDRLDLETNTGEIKKYSYMPTPDHKYLLELGVDLKQEYPTLNNLNIFAEAVDLTEKHDTVEEISFYKYSPEDKNVGKLRNSQNPINVDITELEKKYVGEVFESGEEKTIKKERQGKTYTHTYIPALVSEEDNETKWWNSFVIGVVYNTDIMNREIVKSRNLYLMNALIMFAAFAAFIFIVVFLLKKFQHMAYHDQLTGLPNRKLFEENIDRLMLSNSQNNRKIAIMFIDINNFKEINDNYGHGTGDEVLKKTAERLNKCLRKSDYISRLGGDEFAIAIANINSRKAVIKITDRIIETFDEPLKIGMSKFFISISIGISLYPEHSRQLEELIKKADHAMYKAKEQQKNFVLYEE